uniref:Uncharacterized protein n=1 Tax=Marmota marmota marmota TaxID=9994 RepID=A0A8C5ZTN7_MARMA
ACTLVPFHILTTFPLGDFSKASGFKVQGPKIFNEQLTLIAIYNPYFLILLILLFFMLMNPYYKGKERKKLRKTTTDSTKK